MNWFIDTLKSSVGKKVLMSITGLCFCGFLAGHLGGNLTIYGGKEMFNSYAEHLHALGVQIQRAKDFVLNAEASDYETVRRMAEAYFRNIDALS